MNLSEEEIRKDEEIFLTRLHSYIEELKSSVIKDGLHILGEVEKGQRLVSLIHALLYVENSGMMAAEEAVAKSLSYSLESLQAKPYENKNGKTNLMILDDIRNMTDELIESILKRESYEPIFLKYPEYHVKEEKYIRDLEKN
ncbi:cobaltochelatase subunit CobN, partial [Escherichia coli]|nr:cobaltochelatase subunit CobN [Escherichia coli]